MKNTNPKFSVVTPVHLWSDERVNQFLRCIESVKKQTFRDFEWIVVNDGSTVPFNWDLLNQATPNVVLIKKVHEERVIAYNTAFDKAQGEWFVLLDSDDELIPQTLFRLNEIIKENPQEKMFNFGCFMKHKDGKTSIRDPFTPKMNGNNYGHEKFGGGNIVNGTFIFHKDIPFDLGAFPSSVLKDIDCTSINYGGVRNLSMATPYDFSAAAQIGFPEIREYFMVDHENEPEKILKELGNPWGNDYFLFYKYTRKYHSKPIDEYLYIVNLK